MNLIFGNKIIEAPLTSILTKLRIDTGNCYFEKVGREGQEHLQIQCPFHNSGHEAHMSASLYNDSENPEVEYGFFKCFTCGKKMPLHKMVSLCFDKDDNGDYGKQWLIDNFGNIINVKQLLPEFKTPKKPSKIILDESVLNEYNYIHPYMYKRKLTNDVIAKYKIGYDQSSDCITFPCWDKNGNLVAVNRRSINGKRFELVSNVEKEIYLLNFALAENASTVYVVESQFNALSFMSKYKNTHAIALLGTGCKHQYEILNKTGIRNYVLMFDGDMAGRKGAERFIKYINSDCIITDIVMPTGKDVNDIIDTQEMDDILLKNGIEIS